MKLFLDTADPKELKQYRHWGVVDGVTTNPTFQYKEGIVSDIDMVQNLMDVFDGEIHVEALGKERDEVMDNIDRIRGAFSKKEGQRLVYKIPFGKVGLDVMNHIFTKWEPSDDARPKVNLHLVFSPNQALLAGQAGVDYICPLVGRFEDTSHNGIENVRKMVEIFKMSNIHYTTIMASSIRYPKHVIELVSLGVGAITIPHRVFQQMFDHPLTDQALERFLQDLQKCQTT